MQPHKERPAWSKTTPVIVFITLALVTIVSWRLTEQVFQDRAADRFERLTQQIADAVAVRMDFYVEALVHTRAFFAASPDVSREQFRSFVEGIAITRRYPGIQGVGYSVRIAPEELPAHEQEIRAEGFPHYNVWPRDERDEYHAIIYLEPFNWRNQRALGYDMYSEPTRRDAMSRARDTGQPAMSGAVMLVQETREDRQPGFLIYVPVYEGGAPPPSLAERRAQLEGFAYSPFRSRDLFDRIFGATRIDADFRIYSTNGEEPTLLYNSRRAPISVDATLTQSLTLDIAGQPWDMEFQAHSGFVSWAERTVPWYVLSFGLLISMMASVLVANRVRQRAWERSLLQREQVFRQKAEEEVRAREEFLSVASHELKNPLTSLSLQLQILDRLTNRFSEDAVMKEQMGKHLSTLMRQCQHLNLLIDNLLDITRARGGNLALALEQFDLTQLVHDVIQRYAPQVERAAASIRLNLPSEPVTGYWDRFRVEQVFVNLLTNAIKYGGGSPIQVTLQTRNNDVMLTVADQGQGIPADEQEKIFASFVRSRAARSVRGLGLGLYISREIVEAHGGDITVDSTPGQGAAFTVRLPRQPT